MSRLWILSILILVLSSCGESSLLTPELSEDGEVDVLTVADGALVAPDEAVPVSLEQRTPDGSSPLPPDYLEIEVTDTAGTVVVSTRVEGEALELDDIPPVSLPDLEPAPYEIVFTVVRAGEPVAERRRRVFVVDDPTAFAISGIATYPPSLAPKRRGVAQATVRAPAGSRAWLRWRLEDRVVHEGALSDGADQITLEAPEASGAYALSLELFPHGRPTAGYNGPAPVRQQARLYVRAAGDTADRALGPRESYFSLFHFEGSAEDVGVGGAVTGGRAVDAEPLGEPRLRVSDRLFGYELDGASGFEVAGLIVPFRGRSLAPFSLNFRLRADELEGGADILSMQASDSGFALRLGVDGEGLPTLELAAGDDRDAGSPLQPLFAVGEPLDVSIAVLPGPDLTRVRWYADGRYVSESRLELGFEPPAADADWSRRPGITRLGGENGFVGIIDEFGVYFRDSDGEPAVYTDMYRDARRRELGPTLAYAEGFDADAVPPAVTTAGRVGSEQGLLLLGEDAEAELPAFTLDGDTLIVEVAVPDLEGPPVELVFEVAGRRLFSVDSAGAFEDWQGATRSVAVGSPVRLRLSASGQGLEAAIGAETLTVPLRGGAAPDEVSLRLRGPREALTARVESVLVYREADRVATTPPGARAGDESGEEALP